MIRRTIRCQVKAQRRLQSAAQQTHFDTNKPVSKKMIDANPDLSLDATEFSSYLSEVLSISDRLLVCRQGRIVEEFSPAVATDASVMFAAVH